MIRRSSVMFVASIAACTPLHEDDPNGGPPGSLDAGAPEGSVDAGADTRADGESDAPLEDTGAACSALDTFASDIYVDVNAATAQYGTKACPYRSIRDALSAATRSRAAQRIVHVAAGVYGGPGEAFPIVLRNGVSLVGAGAAATTIQGAGRIQSSPGDTWTSLDATIEIGDRETATALRGVNVLAPTGTSSGERVGVFCRNGNVRFPQTSLPPENTEVSDIEVGSGFTSDIKLVGADYGCNMQIVRSHLQGSSAGLWGAGVFVAGGGCGGYGSPANPFPVALAIGDGSSTGGNTFDGFRGSPGNAVSIQGCISAFSMTNNVVQDSDVGLWLEVLPDVGDPLPTIDVTGNTFQRIHGASFQDNTSAPVHAGGVYMQAPRANVRDFSYNVFSAVSAPAGEPVAALTIGALADGLAFPSLFHARGNTFIGNDIGVLVQSAGSNKLTSASVIDFGTGGGGNNEFRCNARSAAFPGGDFVVDANADATAAISLSGNLWDHDIPTRTTASTATAVDGTDVALRRAPAPAVDTGSPRLATAQCPVGLAP